MIDQINNYQDFFTKGFVHGNILSHKDISKFEKFHFIDCRQEDIPNNSSLPPKELIPLFNDYASKFESKLISKLFTNFKRLDFGMWQGVDLESMDWHNDNLYGESFNSNILIYLEDHTETALEVKSQSAEIKIPVRSGDFIWINQSLNFQHRARQESGKRRILSFEYFLPGLV